MVPFFFNLSFFDQRSPDSQALDLSLVASVVANVSGLMTGGLHLFLRSNTLSTIGPKDKWEESDRQKLKRDIRVWGPGSGGSSSNYSSRTVQPVSAPRPLQRTNSEETLIHEKEEEAMIESPTSLTYEKTNPLRSNAVYAMATPPRAPEPARITTSQTPRAHAQTSSYSLFPDKSSAASTKSVTLLPATTYSPGGSTIASLAKAPDAFDALKPPPSFQGRHRRDSSMVSSATVQIGLRFSNVEDMPPLNSRYFQDTHKVYNLDCPNARNESGSSSMRPSPLNTLHANKAQDDEEYDYDESIYSRDPEKDAKMKTLPPVPNSAAAKDVDLAPLMLSPTVYKPESPTSRTKLPSPKGVGFNAPQRSNTNRGSPTTPSQAMRSAGGATKGDWI
jgi:hypothetical protein